MKHHLTDGNKNRIRKNIIKGAKNYDTFLNGKVFKILCHDETTVCIRFFSDDFKHLTGIETDLSENDFFRMCLEEKINNGNILSEQKYDWSTLKSKVTRIANLQELLYSKSDKILLLKNLNTHTKIFPTAIRNNSMKTCVAFVGSINKARSLRKAGTSKDADEEKKIIMIVAKKETLDIYDELVYLKDEKKLKDCSKRIFTDIDDKIKDTLNLKED